MDSHSCFRSPVTTRRPARRYQHAALIVSPSLRCRYACTQAPSESVHLLCDLVGALPLSTFVQPQRQERSPQDLLIRVLQFRKRHGYGSCLVKRHPVQHRKNAANRASTRCSC